MLAGNINIVTISFLMLLKANRYLDTMHMSKKAIYNQLVSAHGEQFEPAEAQYAVDHLAE